MTTPRRIGKVSTVFCFVGCINSFDGGPDVCISIMADFPAGLTPEPGFGEDPDSPPASPGTTLLEIGVIVAGALGLLGAEAIAGAGVSVDGAATITLDEESAGVFGRFLINAAEGDAVTIGEDVTLTAEEQALADSIAESNMPTIPADFNGSASPDFDGVFTVFGGGQHLIFEVHDYFE